METSKEALEFLSKQAVAAHTAVICPPAEPGHIYFMRGAEGTVDMYEARPRPRAYKASSLKDLANLYAVVTATTKSTKSDASAIAFVGGDCVEIILDECDTRRERLTFKLTGTKAFETLRRLQAQPSADGQEQFIQLLRIALCGCVGKATIQLLRKLKSTRSGEGESVVKSSSKALSRSVLIEASAGGGEAPEEIVVNVPIYEEFASGDGCRRYPIVCGLLMGLEEFTFTLIPMAGQIEQAYLAEQQRIAEELRFLVEKENCTVVCGKA